MTCFKLLDKDGQAVWGGGGGLMTSADDLLLIKHMVLVNITRLEYSEVLAGGGKFGGGGVREVC